MFSFTKIASALTIVSLAIASVSAEGHGRSSLEARSVAKAAAARRALGRRAAAAAPGVYSGSGTALADTPESVAAGQIKCIQTSDCAAAPTIPGSRAVCISGGCRLRCDTGFIPFGGTPPSQCIADNETCTNVDDINDTITCPTVINGWTRCNFHGTICNLKCLKAWRLQDNKDGSYTCLDIYHDADNCGGAGIKCASDYNGLPGSAPRCLSGKCSLYCPTGTSPTATGSADHPTTCA